MTTTFWGNLQTSSATSAGIILRGKKDIDYVLLDCEVVNDSEIFIGCLVETIQTDAADSDRYMVTFTADESKTNLGIVPDTIHNRRVMENSNTATYTKALTFSDGDKIQVAVPIGGLIVSAVLAKQQGTLIPGARLVAAGSGTLKAHPDDITVDTHTTGTTVTIATSGIGVDPTVAIMLCRSLTENATQWVSVKMIGG